MSNQPHIHIIGGGLIGLATARACLDQGASVTVFEHQSQTGHGAGFSNSGMIHPSQSWPWVTGHLDEGAQLQAARHVASLSENAATLLKSRMRALGLDDLSRGPGCYKIFEDIELRSRAHKHYNQIGIQSENKELLSRPALYFPDDFSGNAYHWSAAETLALRQDGAVIKTGVNSEIRMSQDKACVFINDAPIEADHIIICAGYKTNSLLAPLEVSLPIKAVRGFALNFDITKLKPSALMPDTGKEAPLVDVPIMDAQTHSALTLFGGQLRLSGTLGEQSARKLWQRWCEIMPDIMGQLNTPQLVWSGQRPVCALGRPIIAQSPHIGLWVNSGHGHMGWTLSMASGELIADMVLNGKQDKRFTWPSTHGT